MCYTLVYKGQPGQKILKNIYLESEKSDILQNNLHNLKEYQTYLQHIKGLLMTDLDDLRPNTVSSEARPFLLPIMIKVDMTKFLNLGFGRSTITLSYSTSGNCNIETR